MKHHPISFLLCMLLCFFSFSVNSQIVTDTTLTPLQLVQSLAGPGITVSNVTYTGHPGARGLFYSTGTPLPIDSGIFLSTGRSLPFDTVSGFTLMHPNQNATDSMLAICLGTQWNNLVDVAALEFDLVSTDDSIEFSFFFASEEYNDWIGTDFYDGFAIFIDSINVALVPGTNLPIHINNLNNGFSPPSLPSTGPCLNCSYFIENIFVPNFVFDGQTTQITSRYPLAPLQSYHIKIVIGDVQDPMFDSGLFLKAGSMHIVDTCSWLGVLAGPATASTCNNTVQLSTSASIGSVSYNWSPATGLSDPTISNPVVNYAFNQQYVVTVIDTITGCMNSDTVLISAYNDHSETIYKCSTYPVYLSLPPGAVSYNWLSFADTSGTVTPLTNTTQTILRYFPGIYIGSATFPGCTVTKTITVVDTCASMTEVWPGDCNYDLIANNVDFLYIGLANNSSGPVRQSISTTWFPFYCNNWSNNFSNGMNFKHADCNGNGIVQVSDSVAITQNYGLNHPYRTSPPATTSNPYDLRLVANKDTAWLNEWVQFDLVVGNIGQLVDSLYGVAYTLNFDNLLLDLSQTSISHTNSVLGTYGTNMYSFTMDFSTTGRIEAALCRTNHSNAYSLSGPIATIAVKIASSITTDSILNFALSNITALTASGAPVLFNLVPDSVILAVNFNSINETSSGQPKLNIYPNPVQGSFTIANANFRNGATVKILDVCGREVFSVNYQEKNSESVSMDVSTLNAGLYFVQLFSEEGMQVGSFVKE